MIEFPVLFKTLAASGDIVAELQKFLLRSGRTDTLQHVIRVTTAGMRLAARFELPLKSVRLACMAHDLAAVVPLHQIVATAESLAVPLSAEDRLIPQVLHGRIAAAVLAHVYGLDDPGVLDAIRFHTTLRQRATALDQLVFVADKLAYDPKTTGTGYHSRLKAGVADAPLATLCWIYLDWAVEEGPSMGWHLHSDLLGAWDELRPAAE
jgi:predicted HD superfamily hydrolase involved in NAD metabolism